jgi:hypothetical protein
MAQEKARVQLGSSGYWLKEVEAEEPLVLQQDVSLPPQIIPAIIELASQYRAMRDASRSEREYKPLEVVADREIWMVVSYKPGHTPAEKLRDTTLQVPPGRKIYMHITTLLRMADALTGYQEKGTLEKGD